MYYFDGNFTDLAQRIDNQEDTENFFVVNRINEIGHKYAELVHFHRKGNCYRLYGVKMGDLYYFGIKEEITNEI